MYSGLSQNFIRTMKLPAQKKYIYGVIDSNINVNPKNIIQNSVRISNRCSDNSNITIGNVYIGQLNVTLTGLNIERGSYRGREIVLYENLLVDEENNTFEPVLLGHFFIDDPQHTSSGVEIVAYDSMSKFDKEVPDNLRTSGTLYQFISDACTACNVTLGMTQQEITAMPNGNETLSLYEDNDIEYYRDLISWCAQTMGANALISRSGGLIFKCYGSTIVETFNPKDRFEGGKYSDFDSFFTAIVMTNIKGNTTSYYALSTDDGLYMELGSNPLLQPASDSSADMSAIETKRRRILTAISSFSYTPFTVNINRPFIYDLMDVIKLSGGLVGEDDLTSCITSYNWSYLSGYTIQCVGTNPALATGKAKFNKVVNEIIPVISEISETIDNIQENKQNTIDITDTTPSSGSGGDLALIENQDGYYDWWTYDDSENEWAKVDLGLDDKQNAITFSTTAPSGGSDGDIAFYSSDGGNTYGVYKNDNGTWTQVPLSGTGSDLITISNVDIGVGANLATGHVYLVYEG